MEDIILIGSDGCMRELLFQIIEIKNEIQWNVIGYVDNIKGEPCRVGGKTYPYLGNDDWLLRQKEEKNVIISVGDPALRKKIAYKLQENKYLKFPSVIIGKNNVCSDARIGQGCIISNGSFISTNVKLGDFVFINTGVTISHDGEIGNFSTISPRALLAGNVSLGELGNVGMGSNIIQGIHIGKNVVIGAGSVVVKNVQDNCTIAGVPAKIVR